MQQQFGFNLRYQHPISTREQLNELEQHYDAIFLGIGLGATRSLGIPGEDLDGCIGATEYIEQVKITPLEVETGQNVVVFVRPTVIQLLLARFLNK